MRPPLVATVRVTLAFFALSLLPIAALAGVVHTTSPTMVHQQSHATIIRHGGSQTDWPQLGFEPGHSAYNPDENTIGTKNVGQLQQAWSFSTGSGNNAGNVVEAGGVVYAPSANGTVYAIDALSGTQIWSFAAGAGYASSGSAPVYDNGMVFTVCNTGASTQGICALNASNATPVWSYTFPGSTAYDGTPPVVSGGSLFYEACAVSGCSYVALNEQTGAVVWTVAEWQGSCEGNGGITPAVAYGIVYVGVTCAGSTAGALAGLIVGDGHVKWTHGDDFWGQNAGLSVSNGHFVYVGDQNGYEFPLGFKAKHGRIHWIGHGAVMSSQQSMPALAKDVFYWTVDQYISAQSSKSGKGVWARTAPGSTNFTSWTSVANNVVYTACGASPCAWEADNATPLLTGTGGPSYGTPIIVNGVVYGACNSSNVCAWTLPNMMRRKR